jgi:hypothetical protein
LRMQFLQPRSLLARRDVKHEAFDLRVGKHPPGGQTRVIAPEPPRILRRLLRLRMEPS